jgi:hypothetical protein
MPALRATKLSEALSRSAIVCDTNASLKTQVRSSVVPAASMHAFDAIFRHLAA